MKRKLFLTVVSILTLATVFVHDLTAYASSERADFKSTWNDYAYTDEFKRMLDDYGEVYARQFIEDVVSRKRTDSLLRGGGGNICYQYVKNIKQTKTYNCGSATVIQTLYGLNSAGNVSGNSDSSKISFIDAKYNVDSQRSLYVYQVVDALNTYKPSGTGRYIYEMGSSVTERQFLNNIADSLTYCKPVVLHAQTQKISYYNGHKSGHYISLDYVDRTNRVVRLVDCNYNSSYYGVHGNVSVSDAYNAVSESGRYYIY